MRDYYKTQPPLGLTEAQREIWSLQLAIDCLGDEIKEKQRQIQGLERKKEAVFSDCKHDWEEKYTPIHYEGYRVPSDRERGLELGVDSRPATYVSATTEKKWTRTCKKCGKQEVTSRTREIKQELPSWNS